MTRYKPLHRAVDNIAAMADIGPVVKWLHERAARSPEVAQDAMVRAVTNWHADAIRTMPVRASRSQRQKNRGAKGPLYRRVGRGQLRKRTQPFIRRAGDAVTGGIVSGAHYAIWLMAGTRTIAGGRVMNWRPGDPPITDWPAKRAGGSPRAQMPIIITYYRRARDQFAEHLLKEV